MLEELHVKYSLLYSIVTDRSGKRWQEFGSKEAVPFEGIIKNYTPGPDSMDATFKLLSSKKDGIINVRQGNLSCHISLLSDDLLACCYYIDNEDVLERMKKAKALHESLMKAYGNQGAIN